MDFGPRHIVQLPATSDESIPTGLIATGKAGHLYGVTSSGGNSHPNRSSSSPLLCWKLDRDRAAQLAGGSDGAYIGGLTVDPLGNLYGTTEMGGVGQLANAAQSSSVAVLGNLDALDSVFILAAQPMGPSRLA